MGIEDISLKQERDAEPEIVDKKLAAKLQEINDAWTVCPERAVRLVRHYKLMRYEFAECFRHGNFPNVFNAWCATVNSVVPIVQNLKDFPDVTIRAIAETTNYEVRWLTPKNKKVFHTTEIVYTGDTVIVNNHYIPSADKFCLALFDRFGKDAQKHGIKIFMREKCLWRGILAAQRVERSKLL